MDRILKFAEEYYLDNGHSPAASTIAAEIGISRATAYRYLVEMNDRGMVDYDGQKIQTAVTKKMNSEINRTAIAGSVPCGSPQYEEENEKIILRPENKQMKDIVVDGCCIQGVACHIIRAL